jgi:DNA-binding NtrC family response regulator
MMNIKNIHVLVIEDSQDQAWSLKKMLEMGSSGDITFTAETAQDLPTATAALQSQRVDVTLLDLHIPYAPSGADLVKVIKAIEPNTDLIAITGQDDPELKQRVLEAGANHYMLKPADPTELIKNMMHLVINRKSQETKQKMDQLLDRLGPAMEAAAKVGGSGGFPIIKSDLIQPPSDDDDDLPPLPPVGGSGS